MSQDGILGQTAAEFLLRGTSDDELYRLLTRYGSGADPIFKGFPKSPNTLSAKPVRSRLVRALTRETEFAEALLRLPNSAWQDRSALLGMLDEAWLEQNWRDLARLLQDPYLFTGTIFENMEAIISDW